MRLAICDDEPAFCELLQRYLVEYFEDANIASPEIAIFYSGDSLLDAQETFDIVFLDVEMPGLSGIHTGKELLRRDKHTLYIIITSHADYLDEALHFHAFRYLSKPLDKRRLFRNLRDALKYHASTTEKIAVETKDAVHTIYTSDIIMIEAQGKKVYVRTTKRDYLSAQKMDAWEKQLSPSCFFRTHRSYIVNFKHVDEFNSYAVSLFGSQIHAYLTVRKYTAFKHAYLLYLETMK